MEEYTVIHGSGLEREGVDIAVGAGLDLSEINGASATGGNFITRGFFPRRISSLYNLIQCGTEAQFVYYLRIRRYDERCFPHTWPHVLIWPTLLHFAAMSSIEYSQYKDAVYSNLFIGIVFGEG